MTGSTSTTCSPSTVRTMRKTPGVAGCCGPTLTLRSIVSSSRSWGARYSVVMRLAALLPGGQRLQRLGHRPPLLLRRGAAGGEAAQEIEGQARVPLPRLHAPEQVLAPDRDGDVEAGLRRGHLDAGQ